MSRRTSQEWIELLADEARFYPFPYTFSHYDPLPFPHYDEKARNAQEKTGLKESVLVGQCKIDGKDVVLIVMDNRFMMGSLGTIAGELICRAFEHAMKKALPVVAVVSSGGARMHEGTYSLMQMVNTSAVVHSHHKKGLLYVAIITDPTLGGVSASFASLADIIIAQPDATFGFTGRRIIEDTLKAKLPDDFQNGAFALEHGAVDVLCQCTQMKATVAHIVKLHAR